MAVLRNPIDRAYSHYLHLLRAGREPLRDFRAALEAEAERREAGWEWSWHYTRMGFYHEQLTRYLEYFDRDQLSIYLFDDFKDDNLAVTQDVYRAIGVDETFRPSDSIAHAKTGVPISDWFQRFRPPDPPGGPLGAARTGAHPGHEDAAEREPVEARHGPVRPSRARGPL